MRNRKTEILEKRSPIGADGGVNQKRMLITMTLSAVIIAFPFFGCGCSSQTSPGNTIDFKAADIHGNKVQLSQKGKNLLLFFSPSNTYDKMKLFYASALDFKFKGYGLQVIGIAKGDGTNLDEFIQKSGIRFPLVEDKDYELHEQFGVTHCCGATILTNETGKILFFTSSLLDSENLRQLIEKETRGTIDYRQEKVKQDIFVMNKRIPDIRLTESATEQAVDFDDIGGEPLVVTFFSSLCGMCKTGKRLNTLMDMERDLASAGKDRDIKFILVFTGPFDNGDILEWEKSIPMPFDKYITGYLFSEEEKYITAPDVKSDPLTLALDKQRVVTFVEETGIAEDDLSVQLLDLILRRK